MKHRIRIIVMCFLFLLPHTIFSTGGQEQPHSQEDMSPAINWKFFCKDITGNIKVLQYNEIFEITTGNQYKIKFQITRPVYVYIFLYDTNENILLLFPESIHYSRDSLHEGEIYSIPEEQNRWFSLIHNTYIKNLYIIAAPHPQKKLEKLIMQHLAALNDIYLDSNKKDTIKNNLLQEIIRIDRSSNDYVVYAEKPNTFMGDVQDDEKQKELEWVLEENSEK